MIFHLRYFGNDHHRYLVRNTQLISAMCAMMEKLRKDDKMIDIRKFDSLGHANHGWLDARQRHRGR